MPISRRVTARFHKRARTVSLANKPSSDVRREQSTVTNLPVVETRAPAEDRSPVETHSDLVTALTQTSRSQRVTTASANAQPTSESAGFSAYLRDARARAEQILADHPRHEGPNGTSCQPCLVKYPCDAVRAAEDVIGITKKLDLERLLSSRALLQFLTELVELGAAETAPENPATPPPQMH
jgi:hypothetical protein